MGVLLVLTLSLVMKTFWTTCGASTSMRMLGLRNVMAKTARWTGGP